MRKQTDDIPVPGNIISIRFDLYDCGRGCRVYCGTRGVVVAMMGNNEYKHLLMMLTEHGTLATFAFNFVENMIYAFEVLL